ncbi:MAG: YbjQ family protein [Caldilineaceae bacterium SB0670_bin_27]|uniref:YbjQ family protein n=1 Tax=Caldilineaceae bacterium SB0664_bin_27 TaxID=2605260 RepID=A0A6B0YS35_9CHLR|nr:YbjQ family protein [Caldilineaceae bacterium SB0664_bin_27]MYJ78997.1 YbjQ family protein [Caldilineaceae bacterium SB0670_bin_27]
MIAFDRAHDADVEVGEFLVVVVVYAANVVQDVREIIRNLVGGRMTHYESLIAKAIEQGMSDLEEKAASKGYDGVVGVKISHPLVVDGGVEVIIYGNGYRLSTAGPES